MSEQEYKEYKKEYYRQWRKENKEYFRDRYMANRDEIIERTKKWKKENEDKVKEYYQRNKEKYREERKKIIQEKIQSIINKKGLSIKLLSGLTVIADGTVINKVGNEIGHSQSNGYSYVTVNGKKYLKHRLIWEAFMGKIPEGWEIDHINTVRDDNRLENLRLATSKTNKHNPITIERYKISNKGKGVNNTKIYDKKARKRIN